MKPKMEENAPCSPVAVPSMRCALSTMLCTSRSTLTSSSGVRNRSRAWKLPSPVEGECVCQALRRGERGRKREKGRKGFEALTEEAGQTCVADDRPDNPLTLNVGLWMRQPSASVPA